MITAIGEDARAVDHPGLAPLLVLFLDPLVDLQPRLAALLAALVPDVVELPVVAGQLRGVLLHALFVGRVGEVRAVIAAAGLCLPRDRAVAAATEDARPPRAEP